MRNCLFSTEDAGSPTADDVVDAGTIIIRSELLINAHTRCTSPPPVLTNKPLVKYMNILKCSNWPAGLHHNAKRAPRNASYF